jgi:hypothetical protein
VPEKIATPTMERIKEQAKEKDHVKDGEMSLKRI